MTEPNKNNKISEKMNVVEVELPDLDDLGVEGSAEGSDGILSEGEENQLLRSPSKSDTGEGGVTGRKKPPVKSEKRRTPGLKRKKLCERARFLLEKLESREPSSLNHRDRETIRWARNLLAQDPFHVPYTYRKPGEDRLKGTDQARANFAASKRNRSTDEESNAAKKAKSEGPADARRATATSSRNAAAASTSAASSSKISLADRLKSTVASTSGGVGKPSLNLSKKGSAATAATRNTEDSPTMRDKVRELLKVAVIDTGNKIWKISADRWRLVERKLMELLVEYISSSTAGPIPQYDISGWHRGVKIISCTDQFSLDFLKSSVAKVGEVWSNARLQVIPQSEIPECPRARIWLPEPVLPPEVLLRVLSSQNPGIPCNDWRVLKMEEPKPTGRSAIVQLTDESLPLLEETDFRLHCGFNMVQVNVYRGLPRQAQKDLEHMEGAATHADGLQGSPSLAAKADHPPADTVQKMDTTDGVDSTDNGSLGPHCPNSATMDNASGPDQPPSQ